MLLSLDRQEMARLIPALRRYARGLLGHVQAADDLVQDCLVRALAQEKQYRGDGLSGWLFAILTNLSRSRHRAMRRAPQFDPDADPADAGADLATRVGILTALAALPPEQREVLLLTAVEGFSYEETAAILSIPAGTVMSRLWRARNALAARLDGASVVPFRRTR